MISLFNILTSIPIGVNTEKKTKPITIGDIIFPSKVPNWTHILFGNVNKLGFMIVVTKKTKDKIKDQIFISFFSPTITV